MDIPFHELGKQLFAQNCQKIIFPVGAFVAFPRLVVHHANVLELPQNSVQALRFAVYGLVRFLFDETFNFIDILFILSEREKYPKS